MPHRKLLRPLQPRWFRRATRNHEASLPRKSDQKSLGRAPSSLISILPWLRKETGAAGGAKTDRRHPSWGPEKTGHLEKAGSDGPTAATRISAARRHEQATSHRRAVHEEERARAWVVGRAVIKSVTLGKPAVPAYVKAQQAPPALPLQEKAQHPSRLPLITTTTTHPSLRYAASSFHLRLATIYLHPSQ